MLRSELGNLDTGIAQGEHIAAHPIHLIAKNDGEFFILHYVKIFE